MSCPNINSPDWIALVNKHGENKAWQIFAENNNEIPTIIDKPKVQESVADTEIIPQNSTLQEMNKNPSASSEIINQLKKTFPDFVINKGGVIKEDGTFVPLEPGDKGMSIRNGLHSMVAWANDAYLETPPHEYAHIYVDMYRNAPIVKKAIEKYGEEKLVEKIGKYYAEQYTAPGFKKWINRFWKIRQIAGAPNIKYELYKAFRENKVLSKSPSKGTDIVNYQKAAYKRTLSSYTESPQLANKIESLYSFEKDEITENGKVEKNYILNQSFSNLTKKKDIGTLLANSNDLENYSQENYNYDINVLKDAYRDSIKNLIANDKDSSGNYKNITGLDENEDLERLMEIMKTKSEQSDPITLYSLFYLAELNKGKDGIGVDSFPWKRIDGSNSMDANNRKHVRIQEKGIELANKFIEIKKRTYRAEQESKSLVILGNSRLDLETVLKLIEKDIDDTSKKRANLWFNKGFIGRNKLLNAIINNIATFLMTQQSNAKLQSKFLSGKADSVLQKITYEEFENARSRTLKVQEEARDYFKKVTDLKENIDGSFFYNKDNSINDIETVTINYGNSNDELQLTESEFINLYLNLRMKKNRDQIESGKAKVSGFILGDNIKDRNISSNSFQRQTGMTLAKPQIDAINNKVKNNKRFTEIVEQIDLSLDSMFEELNAAHIAETGLSLNKEEFYFPTRYGESNKLSERQQLRKEDFLGSRFSKKGNETSPIRISDTYQIVNGYIDGTANYIGYNLPIQNAKKVISGLQKELQKNPNRKDYKEVKGLISALEGNVNRLTDSSNLYSDQGQSAFAKGVNRILANFSQSVLALNIPTMFKQPVSYIAAENLIDAQYLRGAGWGIGMIAGIKPNEIFQQLRRKKMGEGATIFPVEWKMDPSNPTYAAILEYSPILKERFEGAISRELGETLMDKRLNNSRIKVLFGKQIKKIFGKEGDIEIDKNAMMSGIKAFDIATVTSIWKAVELEAQDKNGPYANKDGTLMVSKSKNKQEEYYEHVAMRTEEIVKGSQPTFDLNNRTALASNPNPFARMLTMFGSARSKLAMLLIEGVVDYNNEPTKQNANLLLRRFVNVSILSAAAIVAVDLLKQFTLGSGFDDDDEILPFIGGKSLSTVMGNFYGVGLISDYIASNLDDAPWRKNLQLPVTALAEDVLDGVVYMAKGDVGKATTKILESSFKVTGTPLYPWVVGKNMYKRANK